MEIFSTIEQDRDDWCIKVSVRTEVSVRPGVVKRRAEKVVRLCGYKTKQDAEADEVRVRTKVAGNKAFW